jgi:hypothetical protein
MTQQLRRTATQQDRTLLRPHQEQVLNLLQNELTLSELRSITSTKYPNRRICEIEDRGFEIVRGQISVEGRPTQTYRFTGNMLVSEASAGSIQREPELQTA